MKKNSWAIGEAPPPPSKYAHAMGR